MTTQTLITILEKSIERHGADKPLTIGHLLGIIKLGEKIDDRDAEFDSINSFDPDWD